MNLNKILKTKYKFSQEVVEAISQENQAKIQQKLGRFSAIFLLSELSRQYSPLLLPI